MKELFKQQFEYANPIDQELLNEIQQKTYDSGEEKQVGDIPLWGFKVTFEIEVDKEELTLTLFSLCEREFPYYLSQFTVLALPASHNYNIPVFVKKGEEEKYESMINNNLKQL